MPFEKGRVLKNIILPQEVSDLCINMENLDSNSKECGFISLISLLVK